MAYYLKKFIVLFMFCLFIPSLVTAKVTPVHKYKQGIINKSTEEANTPCSAHGMYTTAIKNANCTLVTFDKQKCYQCTCPPEYQFTCSATGFAEPGISLTSHSGASAGLFTPFLVLTATGGNNAGLGGVSGGGINPGGINPGDVNTGGVNIGGAFEGGGLTFQFDASDAACTIPGSTPLYKTCDCASGYLPASSFTDNWSSYFSYNGTVATLKGANNGLELKCMQYNSFSCKNGSKLSKAEVSNISGSGNSTTFTANDDIRFITYKAASLLKETTSAKNSFCVTGASVQEPLYDSATRPSGDNDCAEYEVKTVKHFPSKTYGYFNGSCSNSNGCTGSSLEKNPCVLFGGDTVRTFVNGESGTVTCRHALGCQTGKITANGVSFLCMEETSSSLDTGFDVISTTINVTGSGQKTCARVSCDTKKSWSEAYFGTTNSTDYSKGTGTDRYTYDARKKTAGDTTLVCRQPNGCRISETDADSWYNFACSTSINPDSGVDTSKELCWQGYLSYWLPRSGNETKPCTIENCDVLNPDTCECAACETGYAITGEGNCADCGVGCFLCERDLDRGCDRCRSGYEWGLCNGIGRCFICPAGSYLDTNKSCSADGSARCIADNCTIDGCDVCLASGKCDKCKTGYTLNASGGCTRDCSSYTLTSCPSNARCSECGGKYSWDGKSCQQGYKYFNDQSFGAYGATLDGCHNCREYCYAYTSDIENGCLRGSSYDCNRYDTEFQQCINTCNF